jgi:HAD superfamily hydrolase (TIGR01450 family)
MHRVNAIPYVTIQSLSESFTTNGEAAGAWATMELEGSQLRWQTYGRDPIEMTLPLRKPAECWPDPLPPLRHLKRAWRKNAVLNGIEALVFDLDGVLYRDDDPIPNAPEFVAWAIAQGLDIAAVTNNAGRSAADYALKLAKLGYDIPESKIITAGMATARWLANRTPGARIHGLGPAALKVELQEAGCVEVGDDADFVVAGISYDMTVGDLSLATRLLRNGAKLIITNPDETHPTPYGYAPEAGAVQAFLEASGGKAAACVSKPNAFIFQMALDLLGASAETTLMIGDTPETDIKGARAMGMPSALVETGNPTDGAADYSPTVQVEDLAELQALLAASL